MTASDTAFVPVTYTMPSARLGRLRRRKMWRTRPFGLSLTVALIVLNVGLIVLLSMAAALTVFLLSLFVARLIGDALLQGLERILGLSHELAAMLAFPLAIGIFFGIMIVGLTAVRRLFRAKHAAPVDTTITLSPVAAGLHIATRELEYILRWTGIDELLAERDGIVVVCGGGYFLVPNRAFASADARHAFLDHVTAHLTPEALARSETELQRARRK